MLHAKSLRSPYARARVKGVDSTKAKAIPGVVEIITWEDPELKVLGGGGGMAGAGSGSLANDLAVTFLDNLADQEDDYLRYSKRDRPMDQSAGHPGSGFEGPGQSMRESRIADWKEVF